MSKSLSDKVADLEADLEIFVNAARAVVDNWTTNKLADAVGELADILRDFDINGTIT